jgi:hypothetical protein
MSAIGSTAAIPREDEAFSCLFEPARVSKHQYRPGRRFRDASRAAPRNSPDTWQTVIATGSVSDAISICEPHTDELHQEAK